MLLGLNPTAVARRVRTSRASASDTRTAVTVAQSSLTDRLGALQEKVARTFAVWKGHIGGYGRAAVSNAIALIWTDVGDERPRRRTPTEPGRPRCVRGNH